MSTVSMPLKIPGESTTKTYSAPFKGHENFIHSVIFHPNFICCLTGARVQFQNFSSEDNHDFLEVRAGPQHSSALIGQFTGSLIPPVLLSTTHLTIIHFYSDHSENRPGFKMNYQGEVVVIVQPPCLFVCPC